MSCGVLTSLVTKRLSTNLSGVGSGRTEPFTDWMPAIGMDKIKALIRIKALTNQFQCQLAIQTASVRTDNPDAWSNLDQTTTTDRCTNVLDISSTTASKMYVRFGITYNNSSGTALSQADVSLQVGFDACGAIVGSVTLQCLAPDTSNYYAPVTPWLSAIDAAKVKAAILASGVLNNFQCRLTYRTATIEPSVVTDNWAPINLEASWHVGAGEWNTTELTLPITGTGRIDDKMWIQFGLQFTVSSGTAGQATVSVVVAIRPS